MSALPKDNGPDLGIGSLTRRGYNMYTYSGLPFWPLDPRPEDMRIMDIAHSLSNICRFNGHVNSFYSVAQHCVIGSYLIKEEFSLEFLLHENTEAYIGDMIRPVKYHPNMAAFVSIEHIIDDVSRKKWKLPAYMSKEVKECDTRMAWTEKRDILTPHPTIDWGKPVEPFSTIIIPVGPAVAKRQFIKRYEELTGERVS